MKETLLFFLILLICTNSYSQQSIETNALDPTSSGDLINNFDENNILENANQDSVLASIKYRDSINLYNDIYENRLLNLTISDIFSNNWDTLNIFAYGGASYSRASDTLALKLTNDENKFVMPHNGKMWGGFVWRKTHHHNGVDIELLYKDSIVSAFDGIVRYASWNSGGYGYLVIIRHYNGLETYYAHLSKIKCKKNQEVKAGELIGLAGNSGRSYAPHLHFETRYQDNPFDPELIIDFETKQLKTDTLVLMPAEFAFLKTRTKSNNGGVKGVLDGNNHIVYSGDTLWAISRKYNISISQLCSMNGISENSKLQIGQKIKVK